MNDIYFISSVIPHSEIFIDYSILKKQLLTNLIYRVIVQYPSYHP